MIARILCPGPSLAYYVPEPAAAELVIGVNRAAIAFDCHAWAALDPSTVRKCRHQVRGIPVLVTSGDVPNVLGREGIRWLGPVFSHRELGGYLPANINFVLYSATLALVYAAWRGASEIDIYGADLAGTLDYDGLAAGTNRTESRWAGERSIWTAAIGELALRGIGVRLRRPMDSLRET